MNSDELEIPIELIDDLITETELNRLSPTLEQMIDNFCVASNVRPETPPPEMFPFKAPSSKVAFIKAPPTKVAFTKVPTIKVASTKVPSSKTPLPKLAPIPPKRCSKVPTQSSQNSQPKSPPKSPPSKTPPPKMPSSKRVETQSLKKFTELDKLLISHKNEIIECDGLRYRLEIDKLTNNLLQLLSIEQIVFEKIQNLISKEDIDYELLCVRMVTFLIKQSLERNTFEATQLNENKMHKLNGKLQLLFVKMIIERMSFSLDTIVQEILGLDSEERIHFKNSFVQLKAWSLCLHEALYWFPVKQTVVNDIEQSFAMEVLNNEFWSSEECAKEIAKVLKQHQFFQPWLEDNSRSKRLSRKKIGFQ